MPTRATIVHHRRTGCSGRDHQHTDGRADPTGQRRPGDRREVLAEQHTHASARADRQVDPGASFQFRVDQRGHPQQQPEQGDHLRNQSEEDGAPESRRGTRRLWLAPARRPFLAPSFGRRRAARAAAMPLCLAVLRSNSCIGRAGLSPQTQICQILLVVLHDADDEHGEHDQHDPDGHPTPRQRPPHFETKYRQGTMQDHDTSPRCIRISDENSRWSESSADRIS